MTDTDDVVAVIPSFPARGDDDPAQPKEGIDLRPDGGAHVWVDGTKIRLRRPRAREFRKLREALQDHLDDMNETIDAAAAGQVARLAAGDEREARGEARTTPEERREDREWGRRLDAMTEAALTAWWQETFVTLGVDPPAIPDEDLPPWLMEVPACSRLIAHWRAVPSLSGGR